MTRARQTLLVPMGLHVLKLKRPTVVAHPMADFTRLPHSGPFGDVASDTPYVGDEVSAPPYGNIGLTLPEGIHLHWMLPGALRRGGTHRILSQVDLDADGLAELDAGVLPAAVHAALRSHGRDFSPETAVVATELGSRWILRAEGGEMAYRIRRTLPIGKARDDAPNRVHIYDPEIGFPCVPNRWLVVRRSGDRVMRRWIVESDYLFHAGEPGAAAAVTYPVDAEEVGALPYRHLGRVQPLEAWLAAPEENEKGRRLDRLTALGYGAPSFASFYPNCRSVFGFHDAELGAEAHTPPDLAYDVFGWYADPEQDILQGPDLADGIEDRARRIGAKEEEDLERSDWDAIGFQTLADWLGWMVSDAEAEGPVPARSICYARVTIAESESLKPGDGAGPCGADYVSTAFGNTASEAISAFLAAEMGDDERSVRRLEEQLESLHLSTQLERERNDLLFKFRAARHRDGFAARGAGPVWIVTRKASPDDQSGTQLQGASDVQVPNAAAEMLDAVNRIQTALNREIEDRASLRRELFSAWLKYLDRTAALSPPSAGVPVLESDVVRRYIEDVPLRQVDAASERVARLERDLSSALLDLQNKLDAIGAEAGVTLELATAPEARYWRPHDPVLVIGGRDLGVGLHASPGSAVSCRVMSLPSDLPSSADALSAAIDTILSESAAPAGLHHADGNDWRPFLLEWKADIARIEPSRSSARGVNDTSFIEQNFRHDPGGIDLIPRNESAAKYSTTQRQLVGRSILTKDAKEILTDRLKQLLVRRLAQLRRIDAKEHGTHRPSLEEDQTGSCLHSLLDWFDSEEASDPVRNDKLAVRLKYLWEHLHHSDMPRHAHDLLSVKLGGFHDALLMRRTTMQLPVAMPQGFASERRTAARVRQAVDREGTSSPVMDGTFHPLRAGRLTLKALRLVDCFGQVRDLHFDPAELRLPSAMTDPAEQTPGAARLRPRLAQPARLAFRWLAARPAGAPAGEAEDERRVDEQESNGAAATSPVAGILLHNHLDCTLAAFDGLGRSLGAVDRGGVWRPPPGLPGTPLAGIADPTLRRVLRYFIANPDEDMHRLLESQLRSATPSASDDPALPAFMAGRPLILARARLRIDVEGRLALDQGWEAFAAAVAGGPDALGATGGVDTVRVPVRLGDYGLRDDGLVAFWEERTTPDGRVVFGQGRFEEDERTIVLRPGGPAKTVAMLFDPRGTIHAASGILPVKRLTLPRAYYGPLLGRLQIGFRVGPILSPEGEPRLPIPTVQGHGWVWAEHSDGVPQVTATPKPVAGAKDWGGRRSLRDGWLLLNPMKKEHEEE